MDEMRLTDLRSPLVKKGRRDNTDVLNASLEMIQLNNNDEEELATPLQAVLKGTFIFFLIIICLF